MVEVVLRERKPPILTPSAIPCLHGLPTVNITEGCALGCAYCYIQGYAHYPGSERVILFVNTAEVLREELGRKRRKPCRVYFSPSSDAFQYLPQVQDVSFRTMSVLLEAGVEVAFLTKGFVHERFLRLFAGAPHKVFAQVGITTLDQHFWHTLERRTAPPDMRIRYAASLIQSGVRTTARLDPLIPDLTDTEANLVPLFKALREAGVAEVAASYVFLRPAFAAPLAQQLGKLGFSRDPSEWDYHCFGGGCAGGRMIGPLQRRERFARLDRLARSMGLRIKPCRCKNPELGAEGCAIAGEDLPAGSQRTFVFAR